eukprot:m.477232 g.477232  ORF g.477232 m.477232 type:complete len:343 (+) comp57157_c0_seq17:681-1709(+)
MATLPSTSLATRVIFRLLCSWWRTARIPSRLTRPENLRKIMLFRKGTMIWSNFFEVSTSTNQAPAVGFFLFIARCFMELFSLFSLEAKFGQVFGELAAAERKNTSVLQASFDAERTAHKVTMALLADKQQDAHLLSAALRAESDAHSKTKAHSQQLQTDLWHLQRKWQAETVVQAVREGKALSMPDAAVLAQHWALNIKSEAFPAEKTVQALLEVSNIRLLQRILGQCSYGDALFLLRCLRQAVEFRTVARPRVRQSQHLLSILRRAQCESLQTNFHALDIDDDVILLADLQAVGMIDVDIAEHEVALKQAIREHGPVPTAAEPVFAGASAALPNLLLQIDP